MKIVKQENRLLYEFTGTGEVKDFKFKRFNHSEYAFMYEVTPPGTNTHFEVFSRKLSPVCLNFETRTYSDKMFKEVYPKSKSFGVWAWCFTDFDKAKAKFDELSNKNILNK